MFVIVWEHTFGQIIWEKSGFWEWNQNFLWVNCFLINQTLLIYCFTQIQLVYNKISANTSKILGILVTFIQIRFSFCKCEWSKMGVFWYFFAKNHYDGFILLQKTYIVLKVHFKCFPTMYHTSQKVKPISTSDFFTLVKVKRGWWPVSWTLLYLVIL